MPRLDEGTEQRLKSFAGELARLWGEELVAVVLHGSGAGRHHLPDVSDLNVLVVLKRVTPERLKELARLRRLYRRLPLDVTVLSAQELERLPEAYPIEALELWERRRVLHGEDPFGPHPPSVPPGALRRQLLGELLGKTVRLRELYAELQSARELERVIGELVGPYGALLRAILRVVEPRYPPPEEYLEAVTQVEERLGVELPGLREAYQVKVGAHRPLKDELQQLLERVLDESERLAQRAFRLLRDELGDARASTGTAETGRA